MIDRSPRDSKIPDKSLLKPFDITKFGSEDDPCFGKAYDLNSDECHICGDVEVCAIAFMHHSQSIRLELEKTNKYKDLEEAEMIAIRKVKDFISEKRLEGWGDIRITTIAYKKFRHLDINKEQIKTLL